VKEAVERSEFVDIHDIGGVDPKIFDLITDITDNTVTSEIGFRLNCLLKLLARILTCSDLALKPPARLQSRLYENLQHSNAT